jgi:hypothetical protein
LVIGGYRDDFNVPDTDNPDWAVRRMSYLEKTDTKIRSGRLQVLVFDKWDWLLASPLVHAPRLPYVIEYRSKVNDPANLVSGGGVFGGDWNGDPCPDFSGYPEIYDTDHCFNHFYDLNTIFFSDLKLLFERVDYLYFCPSCGGSQLKRMLGYSFEVNPISHVDADGWNTWRIEVRSTGLRLSVNGHLIATTSDNKWVDGPYFGFLATTNEYEPSIWFLDWFEVAPLDS